MVGEKGELRDVCEHKEGGREGGIFLIRVGLEGE